MTATSLYWISAADAPDTFPELESALEEPNGLLAAGGDLSPERLLDAYRRGIFPWFDEGQPILWWSPDPRCVLFPAEFHVSRRLGRNLRRRRFEVTYNRCFDDVIAECASPRPGQHGTWITDDMSEAYRELHRRGWAHSVEIWQSERLVGGLYGLSIGRAFFGESMFSRADDASKAAMYALCGELSKTGFEILDCQVESAHLESLGAVSIPRAEFRRILDSACGTGDKCRSWPTGRATVTLD